MKKPPIPHRLVFALRAGSCLVLCALRSVRADPLPTPAMLAYYEEDGGASSAALQTRFAFFNQMAADTYTVTGNGVVAGRTFLKDLALARSRQIATFATVSNYGRLGFNPKIAHSIVASPKYTQNFITGMLRKLALGHYQGINVDFEGVAAADRAAFTTFIAKVSLKMHAKGYLVVVSVPAKASDDPSDSWTGAFDFAALGASVDTLQLMTYDENGTWSDPGPVAGLDWVESAVEYAATAAPPVKISLGVPAYGYDWDLTKPKANTQIAWTAIGPLLAATKATPEWDASSSSPFFTYREGGDDHVVWYENAQSIAAKTGLVGKYGLAGVSVFALGMEDASFWQSVEAGF